MKICVFNMRCLCWIWGEKNVQNGLLVGFLFGLFLWHILYIQLSTLDILFVCGWVIQNMLWRIRVLCCREQSVQKEKKLTTGDKYTQDLVYIIKWVFYSLTYILLWYGNIEHLIQCKICTETRKYTHEHINRNGNTRKTRDFCCCCWREWD